MTLFSKHIRFWICFISAGIFLPLGAKAYRFLSMQRELQNAALPSLPAHTVTLLETSHGNNLTRQMTIIYARRADGSTVRVNRMADSFSRTGETENKAIRLATGVYINSYSDVNMKNTRIRDANDQMVKGHALAQADPTSNCTKNFSGTTTLLIPAKYQGMDTVEGYPALKTITETGGSLWTDWCAPAFGCDIVKHHVDFNDGGYSDQIATQLEPGEPDPALFDVANMQEASPLKIATASAQLHHRTVSDRLLPNIMETEKKYQRLKPQNP